MTEDARTTLKILVCAEETEQRQAKRAQFVLHTRKRTSLDEIDVKVRLSWQACLKWRRRFLAKVADELEDLPRSGKPPEITPGERVDLISFVRTTPDDMSSQRSRQKLADACRFSKSTTDRIINKAPTGPQKTRKTVYWCEKSPVPEFSKQQAAIARLHLNPLEDAPVISVDEKPQTRALDQT